MQQNRTIIQEYCIALGLVFIAFLFRSALDPILEDTYIHPPFTIALIISTYFMSWKPSLLAALLGVILINFVFIESHLNPEDQIIKHVIGFIIYSNVILLVLLLSEKVKKYQKNQNVLQEELIYKQKWLQNVLETTPDILFVFDIIQQKLVYANRETITILGQTPDILRAMEGQILQRIVHTDDLAGLHEYIQGFQSARDNEVLETEKSFLHADGSIRVFHIRGAIFRRDDDGRAIEVIGTCRDVTRQKQAEAALQASEEEFRTLFEVAEYGKALIEVKTRNYIRVNRKLCQMTGYSEAELLGITFSEITHPEEREADRERYRQEVETQNYLEVEKRYVRKDGAVIWVRISTTVLRDEQGNPQRTFSIIQDITAKKELESKVREQDIRLHRMMDAIPTGLVIGTPSGRITFANEAYARIVGRSRDEMLDGRVLWTDNTLPEYQDQDRKAMQEAREHGVSGIYEKEYIQPDGMRVPILVSYANLNGPEQELAAFAIDITEQKRKEQELRESEQRYRATFDNAGVGVAHTGLQGQWIGCNQRLCDILGYCHEELMDKTCFDLTHPDDRQEGSQQLEKLLRGEIDNYTLRKRYLRKDKSTVWTQVSVSLQRDENRHPKHFIVVIEDITAQMAAEEQLKQMNQHLEQLVVERTAQLERQSDKLRQLVMETANTEQRERKRLAELLHDHLQQLLVASLMRTDRIIQKSQGQVVESNLAELKVTLEESIRATRSLTAELMPPALQEGDLGGALHWLALRMKSQHHLEVELRMEGCMVLPDTQTRVLLFQSARELLFNVIKHAQTHHAVLTLFCDADSPVRMTVEDYGVGFDTAKPEEKRSEGGYGLFSIRERIRLLGGSFDIQSAPGQGTHVSLSVPTPAPRAIPDAESADSTPPERALKMTKVLLADDHQIVREGIASILEDRPEIEIIGQVSNGLEAVAMTREFCPDVVVMDVNMPVMDGIEATRQIKKNCPDVQVIGLSVYKEEAIAQAMKQAGAVDYLYKGGDVKVLIETIMSSR